MRHKCHEQKQFRHAPYCRIDGDPILILAKKVPQLQKTKQLEEPKQTKDPDQFQSFCRVVFPRRYHNLKWESSWEIDDEPSENVVLGYSAVARYKRIPLVIVCRNEAQQDISKEKDSENIIKDNRLERLS